jgi:hypothetical protein
MRGRLLAAVCIAGLGTAAISASAGTDTPIAATKRPTPIRSWGRVAVFSLYDEASGEYHLAISRHGGPPETPALAPQSTPFEVDIGPGKGGSPTIVYSRCAVTAPEPRGCDLYLYLLNSLSGIESKLVGASSPNASETAPTIWGGRIAWARHYDGGASTGTPRIYTRTLSAPPSRPSRRLPGIPSRFCRHDGCTVRELDLRGRRLALNVGYPGPVCNNGQIRLDSLAGRAIRIANTTCGLDGQTLVGVSFDARNLYFARFCEAGGCDIRTGAFRYSLRTARYSLARIDQRLTGFSYDTAGRAYEVLAPDTAFGYCGNSVEEAPVPVVPPDCQIVLTNRLIFARARAPH